MICLGFNVISCGGMEGRGLGLGGISFLLIFLCLEIEGMWWTMFLGDLMKGISLREDVHNYEIQELLYIPIPLFSFLPLPPSHFLHPLHQSFKLKTQFLPHFSFA